MVCTFAIQLGQGTETAIALAMPIAVLSLTFENLANAGFSIIVDLTDRCAMKGNLKGIYAAQWGMGLFGCLEYFMLCAVRSIWVSAPFKVCSISFRTL